MPVNTDLSSEVWNRYAWLRDNGHLDYVRKALKCENFFAGTQWDSNDLALLKAQRRPALTINKIISTISSVLGEQIYNRTDVAFRPRNEGATDEVADALSKVFLQIRDNNQLDWVRSDVFCDGVVTSRGFFDVRLDFSDSLRGEVRVTQLNPKNVLIDADADTYDPDGWSDVFITKWMSANQIELLYSKADADLLRGRGDTYYPFGYDATDINRDRFGSPTATYWNGAMGDDHYNTVRNVRVIERQHRMLDKVQHFVDISTGDMRPVPEDWDAQRMQEYLAQNPNLSTIKKVVPRIRWTVVADNIVLHDDWSPYKHFTVVPYFPYFRRGRTVGLVENLLGPQELLNKVSSQELHVVNTTANSGWKIKTGALQNMTTAELEQNGATTGLVLELDDINSAEKIQPNQTPSGLDRISFKAEDHIKSISGVSDYMSGFAREDVAAKAVTANKQSGQANLAKVMDNLTRSDHMLARAILDIVQEYYTEERLIKITAGSAQTQQQQQISVNTPTPEGQILNDLTLGEYGIVVTSQPEQDSFEDSQFQQVVDMRTKIGVQIPDKYVIQASRLRDKQQIIQDLEGQQNSPEAQQQAQLQQRQQQAEVSKLESEATSHQADAQLKQAKAQRELAELQSGGGSDDGAAAAQIQAQVELQKMQAEQAMEQQRIEQEFALKREEMERTFALKREEMMANIQLKREQAAAEAQTKAEEAARQQQEQARADRISAVRKLRTKATPATETQGAK